MSEQTEKHDGKQPADHLADHRWKPGQSGNPKGRPKKGDTLAEMIREFLDEDDGEDRKTRKRKLIEAAYEKALEGDAAARSWLSDRGYGKAPQPLVGGGEDASPLDIILSWHRQPRVANGSEPSDAPEDPGAPAGVA